MSRFTPNTFTTGSVAPAGGMLDYELTVPSNTLDISKIKITPSIAAGNNVVEIYRKALRASADLQYVTLPWAAAFFVDPSDNADAEFNGGWVMPYFDEDESLKIHFRFKNNHTVAKTYTVTIEYEYQASDNPGIIGAPEGLAAKAQANGMTILSGVVATKNNSTITEAEFRAIRISALDPITPQDLRTAAEGGTFVPDGVSKIQVTGIVAGPGGAQYSWTSASAGRWYYAWRLKNSVGWSRWTDGNTTPMNVIQWVLTQDVVDSGPPSDWEVWIEEGPYSGTIVVHATRPKIGGNTLLWWVIQVKDAASGSWLTLDNGAAPSEVKYDGSAISHSLVSNGTIISKGSGGWGTAARGDLILLDVRGGNFNVNYCQWGTVDQIVGSTLVFPQGGFRPQVLTDLRLKIVKAPWAWTGGGYLGNEPNHGYWGQGEPDNDGLGAGWIQGDPSTEFTSKAIVVPTTVTNPEVRVWFENIYCRSDGGIHSSGIFGGSSVFLSPTNLYDFNNRNYWLPIYPPATWGSLAFAADGTVVMATAATQTHHYGQSGVRARFRLHPDANGQIQLYAKWTDVTMPVGSAVADVLGLGILLVSNKGAYYTTGVSLMIKGTDGGQVAMNSPYVQYRVNITPYENMLSPGALNFGRPPGGSIVEMRCTFQKHHANSWSAIDPIEVRIGGSGSYTSKSPSNPYTEASSWESGGAEIFIGWIGNCRLTGAAAKLVQFSLLKGLGEFY